MFDAKPDSMPLAFGKLHLSVLLAGFTGVFGKLISLNEGLLVWYRLLITALLFGALLALGRRLPRVSLRDALRIGGVGVLPIDRDGNIILVRQFRYPFDTETLEMPAGKMDHGPENAEECGVRELAEETGCTAGRIVPLGAMYPSPGFLTEVTYLFAALDLTEGETHPDEDEFVETVRLPIAEVERLIAEDRLRDAKTIAAMYRARLKNLF